MPKNLEHSVEGRAEIIAERVHEVGKGDFLVFLDTGAIIDFEKDVMRRAKLIDSSVTSSRFYNRLSWKIFPMFVTDHILSELFTHHRKHELSGRPEISGETFEAVWDMHEKYCTFLRGVDGSDRESEQVRYDAYWAGQLAFPEGHKKKCRDPISRTDRELVASALWSRYTWESIGSSNAKLRYDSAVIISPDCHVSGAVELLMETINLGYDGLSVVSSRG